jgi:hypothetical protein
MIETRMKDGQELDSWMYSQLTVALENLNSVHDAMDGDDGEREKMKEGDGLWANIRAKQDRGGKPAHGNSDAHKDAVKAGKEINKKENIQLKEEPAKSEGERIQNLNNRIKALRDKLSATKSPEQKKLFQDRLKNALQSLSNIRRNQ